MTKRRLVFETQTKRFYEGPEPSSLVENLRDSSDHANMLNGRISEYLMQGLLHIGVPSHFIRRLNMRETLIQHAEILPFSVFVRNRADEAYAKALDFELGSILPRPVIEFHYHNNAGTKTKLSEQELIHFELASLEEIESLKQLSLRANDFLNGVYWNLGYFLVDVTLEFGRQEIDDFQNILMLADDIGPLQAQLWDIANSTENKIVLPELTEIAQRFGIQ